MKNLQDKRFIIIGAGATGVSMAYFLYKHDVSRITVFEKEVLGGGSTGKCAGIVSTQLWNNIDIKLVRRSIEIFEGISRKVPYFHVYKTGLVSIARNEKSKRYLEKIIELLKEEKINFRIYEGKKINEKFSFLKNSKEAILLETPLDIYCDPGMYLYTLYSFLRKENVEFKLLREVEGLKISKNEVKGIWVKGTFYPADVFIICAGAWSNQFLSKIDLKIPMLPYRSQVGVLKKENIENLPIIHDLDKGIYFRPEFPDKIIIGDGTEKKESPLIFRETPDEKFIYQIIPRITEILKGCEEAKYLGGWAGLCSATPDRHPLIGKVEEFENLYILTGLNGFGFMRIPALVENFVSDLLEKRKEIDISPYNLERFKGKKIETFEIKEGFSFID